MEASLEHQDQEKQTGSKRGPLDELESRINAAIEEIRPKMRRTLGELETKVDSALRDVRPTVDSAVKDARPKVDRFIADVQPRMDSLLQTLQTKLAEIRRDLDERARRGSGGSAPEEPRAALPPDASTGTPEESGPQQGESEQG